MYLIVGLGNPGQEYEKTRHNIGFQTLDKYLNKKQINLPNEKFGGQFGKYKINGEDIIFLKPLKYINLSGEVIKKYVDYFKIPLENILIVSDDLDLPVGTYKLRESGGSGGHNGLSNIEHHLQTKNYSRIRIGISNNKLIDTADYVLGRPSQDDQKKLELVFEQVTNIIDDYFLMSFSNLMNKYN